MSIWKCSHCGREITGEQLNDMIRLVCPSCGNRIFFKKRPPIVKRVKAR